MDILHLYSIFSFKWATYKLLKSYVGHNLNFETSKSESLLKKRFKKKKKYINMSSM